MKKEVITPIYKQDAKYYRSAYIKFINNNIEFDCSDGEYGPIRFSIDKFLKAYNDHFKNLLENEKK